MKCPSMFMSWQSDPGTKKFEPKDCLEGKCAQWDEKTGICSRVAEVRILTAIRDVLGRIADNLPPAVSSR